AENLKQAAHKADKIKKDAEDLAAAIGDTVITITMKTGESGRIFGRVTNTQVADVLLSRGINVDRKKIAIEDIKVVGEYKALIDLHKEVKHEVTVAVVSEVVVA
ncbi:MAG: 50S ribosomal protein L9, partial [Spirosomataceae bacterium]